MRHKIDGRLHRNEGQADPPVYQETILLDIVSVQFVLSDTLWRHRIEREIGLLRTNFGSSAGPLMPDVVD